jgi:hypothetical protein
MRFLCNIKEKIFSWILSTRKEIVDFVNSEQLKVCVRMLFPAILMIY